MNNEGVQKYCRRFVEKNNCPFFASEVRETPAVAHVIFHPFHNSCNYTLVTKRILTCDIQTHFMTVCKLW